MGIDFFNLFFNYSTCALKSFHCRHVVNVIVPWCEVELTLQSALHSKSKGQGIPTKRVKNLWQAMAGVYRLQGQSWWQAIPGVYRLHGQSWFTAEPCANWPPNF